MESMESLPRVQIGAALTRLALASLFVSVPRPFLRVEPNRLDLDVGAPRTIYVITHKRDPDTFVSPTVLLMHRGWRALTRDVRFIMRADAFLPGFLTRVVPKPQWLRRALRPFSVGWVLRWAGVYPIDGFHSRPAELWIREALAEEGEMSVGTLLAPETLLAVARAADVTPEALGALPATALSRWRYAAALQSPTGPGIFAGPERRRAERRMMESARAELRVMTNWLRAGGSLLLAPEGRLSPDGLLSPARAGLRLLTRDAPPGTRIQPVAITYDFMTTTRPRMLIELAEPIVDIQGLSGSQLDRRVRSAWLAATRMTCTQLATAILASWSRRAPRGAPVSGKADDLAREMRQLALALQDAGRRVDSALLTDEGALWRANRYLRYAARHGLVSRQRASFTVTPGALPDPDDALSPAALPGVPPDGVGYDRYPMRYAWNEAFEVLGDAGLLGETHYAPPATATPFVAGAGC
jgi:hypothetical protein